MMVVHATYKNGVFTPKGPVDLPEGAEVNFEPQVDELAADDAVGSMNVMSPPMLKIYEILSRRYDGGVDDLAKNHDQHQP